MIRRRLWKYGLPDITFEVDGAATLSAFRQNLRDCLALTGEKR
jgi:hypothetical protein